MGATVVTAGEVTERVWDQKVLFVPGTQVKRGEEEETGAPL